jgi:8-oxo-dGTP pyrophosphatase MutT (NUDIX family)
MAGLIASDVARTVEEFAAGEDGEALKSRDLTLALLSWSSEPFSRMTYTPGHVTCTGVVLGPERDRVLLVHHRRLNRWLLPGGHCEAGDLTIDSVAHREVIEETGAQLAGKQGRLVNIDVHPIPGNGKEPLHLHHDLIFAFEAESLETECSAESRAVVWCGLEQFDRFDLPRPIRRAVEAAKMTFEG